MPRVCSNNPEAIIKYIKEKEIERLTINNERYIIRKATEIVKNNIGNKDMTTMRILIRKLSEEVDRYYK